MTIEMHYDELFDVLYDMLTSEFEDAITNKLASKVPEYDPDWCSEDMTASLVHAKEQYIDQLIGDLLRYYPEEV